MTPPPTPQLSLWGVYHWFPSHLSVLNELPAFTKFIPLYLALAKKTFKSSHTSLFGKVEHFSLNLIKILLLILEEH